MSNEIQKAEEATHDFTQEDLQRIEAFKEGGMLGLANITEVDITRMMDHYLSGMSYREISQILKKDRTVILFLSQKLDWFSMRKTYMQELQLTVRDRVLDAKLQSQEFLLHLGYALQRKIAKSVDRFLRTDSDEDAKLINPKEIEKYLKVVDSLHRLNGEMKPGFGDRPMVGLNAGEGMTIKKVGENEIQITPGTPNKGQVSSRLKQFADMKRNLEKEQNDAKLDDINNETDVEGDTDEIDE